VIFDSKGGFVASGVHWIAGLDVAIRVVMRVCLSWMMEYFLLRLSASSIGEARI
jgi:hypothetical protein